VAVIDNYITLRSLYCCSSKTGKLQAKASSEKYCKAAKNKAEWQLKLCYTTCIGVTHAAYVLHNLCTGYKYISLQKSIAAVCMHVAHVCRKAEISHVCLKQNTANICSNVRAGASAAAMPAMAAPMFMLELPYFLNFTTQINLPNG